ncbi:hypothetical protein Nepgr_007833 [Nepenthes gracilis]|uniref:Uncharacterized protein n=1 Tax=Nepenthes gracilis TaxID=150966 RepID=A0AAD3S7S3_NEPGR|nr:hypothetical protein Nepgr_007833 [Nepenthes gracilis]
MNTFDAVGSAPEFFGRGSVAAASVNSWCSALVSACCGGSSGFNLAAVAAMQLMMLAVAAAYLSGSVSQWSLNCCPWKSSVTMRQIALIL